MASVSDNDMLTQVGAGTPMGELLRRYWIPAGLSSEVAEPGGAVIRVRLLGENLVLYRGIDGKPGLVDEACPHRGTSLYYARNEAGPGGTCGLRCVYHGWQFTSDGKCVDMPPVSPTSRFKDHVTIPSYPTHESGGIIWAYLGPPETITPFRNFGTDERDPATVTVSKTATACNWLQAMEANLDSSHTSWLHWYDGAQDVPDDGTDTPGYISSQMRWRIWNHDRHPRLEVQDTWYGFRYTGLRQTPNGHTHSRVTSYCLPFSVLVASTPFGTGQTVHAPVDDEHTINYRAGGQHIVYPEGFMNPQLGTNFKGTPYETNRSATARRNGGVFVRHLTPANDYEFDRASQTGVTFSGILDFQAQDFMATESMGPVVNHAKEHLTTSDLAISRMRSQLLAAARALEEGRTPPALADDPSHDFRTIRSAEKILEPGEDWRNLGTDNDPIVQQALFLSQTSAG